MSTYTLNQKYAIISILTQIMEADSIIHPKEIEYMNSIYKRLMINAEDLELMDNHDFSTCIQTIKDMPMELKNDAINIFYTMISIDGNIDPREVEIINSL